MSTTIKSRASMAGWATIAVVAVVYAPMAIEYMWRFFNPDSPGLWDHAYSAIVDHDEAYGSGSIHDEQTTEYADNRGTLLLHTTAGGIAIVLFAAQFSARFRRNLARHRAIGRVAVSIALIAMLGAGAYLLAVGPDDTYDGPGFYLQLWGLALGTATAVTLGFVAVVKRQIAMHQALMAYAFALLLTAPLLRVGYLVLGNAWPDTTQLETNYAGAAFLATWAPFGAFLAARGMDHRRRQPAGIPLLPGRSLDLGVVAAAAIATPALAIGYGTAFTALDRVTITGIVGVLAAFAVAVANLIGARRSGATVAAEEWRIQVLALIAALPATWLLWQVYDVPFSTWQAYLGALLTGPAASLSVGFLVVTWRRRRPTTATNQPSEPAERRLRGVEAAHAVDAGAGRSR